MFHLALLLINIDYFQASDQSLSLFCSYFPNEEFYVTVSV